MRKLICNLQMSWFAAVQYAPDAARIFLRLTRNAVPLLNDAHQNLSPGREVCVSREGVEC